MFNAKNLSLISLIGFSIFSFAETDLGNMNAVPNGIDDFSDTRDNLTIIKSDLYKNISGESFKTPWSGSWFPFRANTMVDGIMKDHARYIDKKLEDYKMSPFEKYALYLKKKYGRKNLKFDPDDAVLWEKTNHTFMYGDHPKRPTVLTVFDWRGHCDGLAAASMLFDEPMYPVIKENIIFTPDDQKALLTELSKLTVAKYLGLKVVPETDSDEPPSVGPTPDYFPLEFAKTQTDFLPLLDALDNLKLDVEMMFDKGTIKRLNEYLTISDLFEKIEKTRKIYLSKESKTLFDQTKDFRVKTFNTLNEKEKHLIKKFNRALLRDVFGELSPPKMVIGTYEDVDPAEFHAALYHYIKKLKYPFGMDFEPGEKVHNHPVYKFVTYIQPTKQTNRFMVTTDVVYAHYASEDYQGTNVAVKTYYYDLFTDNTGYVIAGEWAKNRYINRFEEEYRRGLILREQEYKITRPLSKCSFDPENLFCEDKRMTTVSSVDDHPDILWIPKIIAQDVFGEFDGNYEEIKFFGGKTPEKLLEKIKSANLKYKLPKKAQGEEEGAVDFDSLPPIEQLNGILTSPNLYDELMRVFPDMKKTNEMKELEDDTDVARAFSKDVLNLEDPQDVKIFKLNRLAIDSVFPKESPKRKFNLQKNPYIIGQYIREIINLGRSAEPIDNFDPIPKMIERATEYF